jgi:hypothetical protein
MLLGNIQGSITDRSCGVVTWHTGPYVAVKDIVVLSRRAGLLGLLQALDTARQFSDRMRSACGICTSVLKFNPSDRESYLALHGSPSSHRARSSC